MTPKCWTSPHTADSAQARRDITDDEARLAALRRELDRLDDAVHDLLIERSTVVGEIGRSGAKGPVKLRAGREAVILRRLLERHQGALPRQAVVRIWREIFAATTAMQGPHLIAVCEADPGGGFEQCAREHFGALTPLRVHPSPAQALRDVSRGIATAAVLPMPLESDLPGQAWWTALLQKDEPRIHIVAKLPFWVPRPEGAPQVEAFVAASVPPDATGNDRSLVGFEVALEVSRARIAQALAAAGLAPETIVLRRDAGAPEATALADVAGCLDDGDPRLATIGAALRRPTVLGAYAVPFDPGA